MKSSLLSKYSALTSMDYVNVLFLLFFCFKKIKFKLTEFLQTIKHEI